MRPRKADESLVLAASALVSEATTLGARRPERRSGYAGFRWRVDPTATQAHAPQESVATSRGPRGATHAPESPFPPPPTCRGRIGAASTVPPPRPAPKDDLIIACRVAGKQCISATVRHMDTFAKEGLRTLLVAQADLEAELFEEWADQYEEVNPRVSTLEAMGVVVA